MDLRKHENNLIPQMIKFANYIETSGQVSDDLTLDIKE